MLDSRKRQLLAPPVAPQVTTRFVPVVQLADGENGGSVCLIRANGFSRGYGESGL